MNIEKIILLISLLSSLILISACEEVELEKEITKEIGEPKIPEEPKCYTNEDCADDEECVDNKCKVPVCAPGEIVKNHVCVVIPEEDYVEEIPSPEPTPPACTDSDNGKNIYVKGITNGQEDVCYGSNVEEQWCDPILGYQATEIPCPHGCSDGACLEEYEEPDYSDYVINYELSFPKSTYQTGEIVQGIGYVEYVSGDLPFNLFARYIGTRSGYDYLLTIGGFKSLITQESIDHSIHHKYNQDPQAFVITEKEWISTATYFSEPGVYTYRLLIFDCEYVKDRLNEDDCTDAENEDLLDLTPIHSKTLSLTVEGEEYTPECEENQDCTGPCPHCSDGQESCVYPDRVCVDCFMDMQCVSGYHCEDNLCVAD